MTVRTSTLVSQIAILRESGFRAVELGQAVHDLGADERLIAFTADDGHKSIYSEMWPLCRTAGIPVTLFIYPSAISNASYALTWEHLREMMRGGGVAIGSHTFWHPNFRHEKQRLSPEAYRQFVQAQMVRSKEVLQQRLSTAVNYLAWPFGIYDDELIAAAQQAGYTAAFSIERRWSCSADRLMAIPRMLMTDVDSGSRFERLIGTA